MSVVLLLALAGCDQPPPETPGGAPSADAGPTAPQPPEGFRSLELGASFIETSWGPDVEAPDLERFRSVARDAALREDLAEADIAARELELAKALLDRVPEAELDAAVAAYVSAEQQYVSEQIAAMIQLFGAFTDEQMQTRLRMGYPPILAELVASHPRTGAANPFARVDVTPFGDAEREQVLRRKLDVQARFLPYQKVTAEVVADIGKLDFSERGWGARYAATVRPALDAWAAYRTEAVGTFVRFVASLPAETRTAFLHGQGLHGVLAPDPRGAVASGGTPPGENADATGTVAGGPGMGGPGMGGPGGAGMGGPGGPGGPGMGPGGPGMGGPGMGPGGPGGPGGGPGMGPGGGPGGPGMGPGGPGGPGATPAQ